jgi:SAM-dependent MidA family methyltransferase
MDSSSPITVEEFMRRALYDPQRGYYARRISGIGRRGDFTTAPMLDDSLAAGIAAWAAKALRETGCRDLIEIGPGEGRLAAEILRRLPWPLRWKIRLHLIETSEPLREIQQQRLGRRARWHENPAAALAACGGRAVMFSNELVDAFPARVFESTADGWREVALVMESPGSARECLLPVAELPPSSSFTIAHPLGQRVEVHESYRRWLQEWLPLWRAGRMLTIDYGSTAKSLYHRRPRGTLRAYLFQQRLEGPAVYQCPGRQDLTADVNFTDLAAWAQPYANPSQPITLASFLSTHLPPQAKAIADPDLLAPSGVGGAFLALVSGLTIR